MNKPLISACIITFNQENYISECIKGALAQNVGFSYEIIIGDDCSNDNTSKICQKFAQKYPNIIKHFRRTTNLGMTGNWKQTIEDCNGKYIALCEGDDYWTDPHKLQKQVDFLERNDDYGLVHGNCKFLNESKGKWDYSNNGSFEYKGSYDQEEVFYGLINHIYKIRTATVLFKKKLLEKRISNNMDFLMGDTPLWLDFSQMTKFKYIDQVLAVYRVRANSASRPSDKKKQFRFRLSMAEMRIYYSKRYNYRIKNDLIERYNKALLDYKLYNPSYEEYFPLFNPTKYEKYKLQNLAHPLLNRLFKLEHFILSRIKKRIINTQ